MSHSINRRDFMKAGAAGATGLTILGPGVLAKGNSPNDKLNIAGIGLGNRGTSDLDHMHSENIVALCDIDEDALARAGNKYPNAKQYVDFRKCLEQKDLDAVVVAPYDHVHAMISIWAMNRGLHVYCEKPIADSVEEARMLRQVYENNRDKLATQMGTQRHAYDNMARVAELVQRGAIGAPRSVHVWNNREPAMRGPYPAKTPVPKKIHWDLLIGPAPHHPYNPQYVQQDGCLQWNFLRDFSSGQLGDMGSHNMDIAWRPLELGRPENVTVTHGPEVHPQANPSWLVAEWQHPANDWRPEITVRYMHGKRRPSKPSHVFNLDAINHGALFKGDKGYLVAGFKSRYLMLTDNDMRQFDPPEEKDDLLDSPHHHREWIRAAKGEKQTGTDFVYSGDLTEQNLLALIAHRYKGETLEYDAKNMKFPNKPEAEQYLSKEYRHGYTLNG